MDGSNFTTLRKMVESDVEDAVQLAMEKYREYHPRLSYDGARQFCNEAIHNPGYLLLCGADIYFCAACIRSFMEPEPTVGALWIFTRRTNLREVLESLDAMEAWARSLGAVECGWGNINGLDLTPIAKKRGYRHASQYFSKKLNGGVQ
jgi:hypothetical protein